VKGEEFGLGAESVSVGGTFVHPVDVGPCVSWQLTQLIVPASEPITVRAASRSQLSVNCSEALALSEDTPPAPIAALTPRGSLGIPEAGIQRAPQTGGSMSYGTQTPYRFQ